MDAEEFNDKYRYYLEANHYGAEGVDDPVLLEWLDEMFVGFTNYPGFTYSQIKVKFGMGRFYTTNLPEDLVRLVEAKITEFYKKP